MKTMAALNSGKATQDLWFTDLFTYTTKLKELLESTSCPFKCLAPIATGHVCIMDNPNCLIGQLCIHCIHMYRDAATRQVSDSTMTPLTPVKSKPRKVGVGSGKIRKVRVSATHGHKQRSQLSSRASTDKTRKTPLAPKQLNFDSLMSAVDFLADLPPKNQPVEQAPECTQEVENSTWQEIDYLPYIATTVPAMSTSTTMAILSNPSSETSETSEASPVTIMPWEQRYPPILCSRKRNFDDIMDHLQKQLSPENTMYYEYIYITSRKRDVQYTLQMRDYKEKPIIWYKSFTDVLEKIATKNPSDYNKMPVYTFVVHVTNKNDMPFSEDLGNGQPYHIVNAAVFCHELFRAKEVQLEADMPGYSQNIKLDIHAFYSQSYNFSFGKSLVSA